MGKIYKDRKSHGCALCKPHKHGWATTACVKVVDIFGCDTSITVDVEI